MRTSPEVAPLPRTVRELRRAQILVEARVLVAEGGLDALTIGALEQRLPFSRGVITHHFRDKEDVVAAVLQGALAEIDTATAVQVGAQDAFAEKLSAVLRTKILGFCEHEEASYILLAFWGRQQADATAARLNRELFQRYCAEATRLVELGRAEGAVRHDVDAVTLGTLLVSTVIGVVSLHLFGLAPDLEQTSGLAARTLAQGLG